MKHALSRRKSQSLTDPFAAAHLLSIAMKARSTLSIERQQRPPEIPILRIN